MDPLIDFLWKRRAGGRPPEEASEWAVDLLERGIESEAILLLAADSKMDSREQEKLFSQAIRDLGRENLLDAQTLKQAYATAFQQDTIEAFYAGQLDGNSLIRQCVHLYFDAGEPESMRFWIGMGEDSNGHGGQGIYLEYPFGTCSFDEALEFGLAANGFPRPK